MRHEGDVKMALLYISVLAGGCSERGLGAFMLGVWGLGLRSVSGDFSHKRFRY